MDGSSSSSCKLPNYVGIALGITSQSWEDLGLDTSSDAAVAASEDIKVTAERITALLLIRVVAWIQPRGTFTDLSTTTICRHLLVNPDAFPTDSVNETVIRQLHSYVDAVLSGYQDVPYHSFKHCYHVTISTNKLIDLILQDSTPETARPPTTYGFRDDPLMQFCLLFSALVHDVDHRGIPNRQFANEDDELAIKYNDQSIAENHSLYLAFSELLKSPNYDELRQTIFPQKEDYRRFRKEAINLVLATDIASPERSQIGKSKWKEAFGDPYETVERKVLKQLKRRASGDHNPPPAPSSGAGTPGGNKATRRLSTQSIMSDLSFDDNRTKSIRERPGREDELDDDSSVSLSETDDDDNANKMNTESDVDLPLKDAHVSNGGPKMRKVKESGSVGGDSEMSGMALKFHRRLSSAASGAGGTKSAQTRNARLGLLRTVDLSGESIEAFGKMASRTSATGGDTVTPQEIKLGPPEPVDELREAVMMETILTAADVAHNLQGFDQMVKWSNKLYMELRRAYVDGRGDCPQNGWFNNQIGFLDFYLLPVARKLDDMGVFDDQIGAKFAENVQSNRERWTKEGMNVTAQIIMEGEKAYPYDDDSAA
mmetsp:Transcript_24587/g.58328  ORF Transcript_24587/g.58328 Transcript_24587/m.58328 type:complete len:599 (+) Transcript_24587:419-2215(+)|eukprot:CAMPEP_0113456192 /NCGR_PEP_ID=MMETSP0014_2-20120614/8761_1 /TAXON_ID=2857 /ORGANISM="Nitzschia sp." /LENGTH=598 /DNA_ID=CAMNT_0000347639 /DNA_START=198 /DNA_END=1994 /DNA_ORIENTATION=+ /assembly_acc=CAM_ASM_000159